MYFCSIEEYAAILRKRHCEAGGRGNLVPRPTDSRPGNLRYGSVLYRRDAIYGVRSLPHSQPSEIHQNCFLYRCSPSEKAACNPKLLNERGVARCARPRSSLVSGAGRQKMAFPDNPSVCFADTSPYTGEAGEPLIRIAVLRWGRLWGIFPLPFPFLFHKKREPTFVDSQ